MLKSLPALSLLALTAACGGHSSSAPGHLAVILTDAPFAHEFVQSARVTIDRATIDAGPNVLHAVEHVVYAGPPVEVELSSLRNGKFFHLADLELPAGGYRRLRLRLSGAVLDLVSGAHYTSEDGTLTIGSMPVEGFEIPIELPVEVESGQYARLLVDFDLSRSFVPQGAGLGATSSFMLQPVVHAVRPGAAGEIRGQVTRDAGEAGVVGVAGASVYFLPTGVSDPELAVAGTATDADGSYAQVGLLPGTYDVLVLRADASAIVTGEQVNTGDYTLVDVQLP